MNIGVGCTGEVKVDREASDYANWGISILVSYRDGDHLQRLTGSLQSGGVSKTGPLETSSANRTGRNAHSPPSHT